MMLVINQLNRANSFHLILVILVVQLLGCSVHTKRPAQAAIASAHPLATQAGLDILAKGGNAFDAAVAVSAMLAVVEPAGSGLGGGGFWLLHRAKDQHQIMIDGRETAPGKAHADMYLNAEGEVVPSLSLNGPLAAGIPGVPAALDHITERYGRLTLEQNLTPAITRAKQGFPVTARYQKLAQFRLKTLLASQAAADIFLVDNAVPPVGHLVKQNDLANTLSLLASHGREGFYQGVVAEKLIKAVNQASGIWTHRDLQQYQVKQRPVIKTSYRDYQITTANLPSSGGIVISAILNQLKSLPFEQANPDLQRHYLVEAMRRAYYDRSQYLGDSDFIAIPKHLASEHYGAQLAATISPDKATANQPPLTKVNEGNDTTHFSIIDHEGNRVAATLSINYPFGSGFVAEGTGVLLNDEMDDFSAQVGSANGYGLVGNQANAIAPYKRPLSSMTPTFVENEDRLLVLGTPGGSRIITMVVLGLLDFIDGDNVQKIVSAPRFHHQYLPNVIQIEPTGFSLQQQQALIDKGHEIKTLSRRYGNMQAISYDKRQKILTAASDPRGEGSAQTITLPQ